MILALFESGASTELRVSLYRAPGDRARLLDAYVTTECEGAVTRSARRAAEAVLNWLPEKERPSEPMVAGFDLAGTAADQTLAGESAGLAFAVALAAQLSGKDVGNVAVTGILAEGSAGSVILPVKGFPAKLGAAIQHCEVMTLLYPLANQGELDPSQIALANKKGMQLLAVARLDMALAKIFPGEEASARHSPRKPAWPLGFLAAALAGLVLVGFIYWMTIRAGQEAMFVAPADAPEVPLQVTPVMAPTETEKTAIRETVERTSPQKPQPTPPLPEKSSVIPIPGKGFD